MSPPFHVNFCYSLRFPRISALANPRDAAGPARALRVRFDSLGLLADGDWTTTRKSGRSARSHYPSAGGCCHRLAPDPTLKRLSPRTVSEAEWRTTGTSGRWAGIAGQATAADFSDRWEIECNHRDEKALLGVAQGQVWNPNSVRCLPELQVAG